MEYVGSNTKDHPDCFCVQSCHKGKSMKQIVGFVLSLVVLSGCQSTRVVPMDQDSYMIAKKDGTSGLGVSFSTKAEVYREANTFCRAKDLEVMTLEVVTTPARPAQLGSTELRFKCVPPGGTSQPMQRAPDTVIEIRK